MSYPVLAAAAAAAALTYRYFTKKTPEMSVMLNYDADVEDDIYTECPTASFHYDKDHYLASDAFARFIDETIASQKLERENKLSGFGQYVNIENIERINDKTNKK